MPISKTPEQNVLKSFADDVNELSDNSRTLDQEDIAKALGTSLVIVAADLIDCKADENDVRVKRVMATYGNQIHDILGEMFDAVNEKIKSKPAPFNIHPNAHTNREYGIGKYGEFAR